MKLGSSRNYLVSIYPDLWDVPHEHPQTWLTDVVEVSLHQIVTVVFVPDVSELAPPWSTAVLPPPDRPARSAGEYRLSRAMQGPYIVTPNPALAGTAEQLARPDAWPGVVWYLTPADFRRRVDELMAVAAETSPFAPVDRLRGHEVIRFIDADIVDSGRLTERHARWLGR